MRRFYRVIATAEKRQRPRYRGDRESSKPEMRPRVRSDSEAWLWRERTKTIARSVCKHRPVFPSTFAGRDLPLKPSMLHKKTASLLDGATPTEQTRSEEQPNEEQRALHTLGTVIRKLASCISTGCRHCALRKKVMILFFSVDEWTSPHKTLSVHTLTKIHPKHPRQIRWIRRVVSLGYTRKPCGNNPSGHTNRNSRSTHH